MYSQLSKLVHTGRGHPIVVVHVRQEVGEVILDVGQDFVHHAAYHRPVRPNSTSSSHKRFGYARRCSVMHRASMPDTLTCWALITSSGIFRVVSSSQMSSLSNLKSSTKWREDGKDRTDRTRTSTTQRCYRRCSMPLPVNCFYKRTQVFANTG